MFSSSNNCKSENDVDENVYFYTFQGPDHSIKENHIIYSVICLNYFF